MFLRRYFISVIIAMLIATIGIFLFYRESSRIDLYPQGNMDNYIQVIDTPSNYVSNCGNTNNHNCIKINKSDVSLFYKSNIFTIKNTGSGELKIRIWGIYKSKNNKLIPVYNTYKDFKVNGKKIVSNEKLQKLWHGRQYTYSMNVKDGDIITVEYENRFVPSGFDWLKMGLLWLILFALIFYTSLKFSWLKFKQLMERDWFDDIRNFYKNINPVYRHSFWILFIITNIVFGFHTINFLWGNHDWNHIIPGIQFNNSLYEGRYGGFVVSQILTGNLYLPIISALWAFAALSLSAVLLAIYWKLPKKTSYFVIFGLILNITPYTLSWLWYAHWTINIFFGRLFIFAAFVLSDRFLEETIKQKMLYNLVAIFFLSFALGIYPPYIGTFVMVLAGRFLIEMFDWNTLKEGIKKSLFSNKCAILNAFFSIIIFKSIFEYLKYKNVILAGKYNVKTITFSELPDRMIECFKAIWQQITCFSTSFYPDMLTKLFLLLLLILIIQIAMLQKPILQKLFILLSFFLTLLATKTSAIIAANNAIYLARVEFCGFVLFNALLIALSLRLGGIMQNMKILIGCLIIYLFAVNDLHQQRTSKLGFDSEKMIWNRIQTEIEGREQFDKNIQYTIIQIGYPMARREEFYPQRKDTYKDVDLLVWSYIPYWRGIWMPSFYNQNYAKTVIAGENISERNSEFMSALRRLNGAGLLENAKAWPAKNSIIVYEDIILLVTDEKDLQKAKKLLAEQEQKEQALKDKIKAAAKPATTSQPQPAEAK